MGLTPDHGLVSIANSELDHAACLLIGSKGVLLRGSSGSGKSLLRRHLSHQCLLQDLFTALISDDYVHLIAPETSPGAILALAPEATFGQQEVRGLGVHPVPKAQKCEKQALIHLVVDLIDSDALERMPSQDQCQISLLGRVLPRLAVPRHNVIVASDLIFAYLSTQHS